MKDPHEPLEALREAASLSQVFASFANSIAYGGDPEQFTYGEPDGTSIEDVDARLGSTADVVDPLLTAHRMIRFHLLSAGDAIYSMSSLLKGAYPLLVGSAALGRTAVEHASRAMFLSDTGTRDPYRRIQRASTLMEKGINEYRPSMPDHEAANRLVRCWKDFMARNRPAFSNIKKEKVSQYSALVERYFPNIGYVEMSRPTHGNAIWVILTTISEQQGGGTARVHALHALAYCIDCLITTCESVMNLWQLDVPQVEAWANRDNRGEPTTWDTMLQARDALVTKAQSFEPKDYAGFVDNPHPYGHV